MDRLFFRFSIMLATFIFGISFSITTAQASWNGLEWGITSDEIFKRLKTSLKNTLNISKLIYEEVYKAALFQMGKDVRSKHHFKFIMK